MLETVSPRVSNTRVVERTSTCVVLTIVALTVTATNLFSLGAVFGAAAFGPVLYSSPNDDHERDDKRHWLQTSTSGFAHGSCRSKDPVSSGVWTVESNGDWVYMASQQTRQTTRPDQSGAPTTQCLPKHASRSNSPAETKHARRREYDVR